MKSAAFFCLGCYYLDRQEAINCMPSLIALWQKAFAESAMIAALKGPIDPSEAIEVFL